MASPRAPGRVRFPAAVVDPAFNKSKFPNRHRDLNGDCPATHPDQDVSEQDGNSRPGKVEIVVPESSVLFFLKRNTLN